jgi:hypothetical protein
MQSPRQRGRAKRFAFGALVLSISAFGLSATGVEPVAASRPCNTYAYHEHTFSADYVNTRALQLSTWSWYKNWRSIDIFNNDSSYDHSTCSAQTSRPFSKLDAYIEWNS